VTQKHKNIETTRLKQIKYKITLQSKASHSRMYVLVRMTLTHDFDLDIDLDVLKMCMRVQINCAGG